MIVTTVEAKVRTLLGLFLTAVDELVNIEEYFDYSGHEKALEYYKERITEIIDMADTLCGEEYWQTVCLAGRPIDDLKVNILLRAIHALELNSSDEEDFLKTEMRLL